MAHSLARGTAALALTVLAVGSLAACGSGGSDAQGSATPAQISTQAAEANESAATKETTTQAGPGDDAGATAEFLDRLEAGLDGIETVQTAVVMEVSGMAITSSGVIDYTTDPLSMSMGIRLPVGSLNLVAVDGTTYLTMDGLTQGKWVEVSPEDLDEMGLEEITAGSDPLAEMNEFRDAIVSVTNEGSETLDGVETDRFRVAVDTTAIAEDADLADGDLPATLDYTIWLDAENRTVQMAFEAEIEGELVSVTTTMFDFNEPVTIEAPPADQIVDPAVLQGAGSLQG